MTVATKDVSTSSGGTSSTSAFAAPSGLTGGLAPALPPGASVSRGVAATLRQLAADHNERHGADRKKRADMRALRVAYRRGAARKPRPGRTRRQEGLARVQAHLAALSGKSLPQEYDADRALLPGEEKRLAVLALEGGDAEPDYVKALAVHPTAPAEPEHKAAEAPALERKTWSDESRIAALAARRSHMHSHHEGLIDKADQATEHLDTDGVTPSSISGVPQDTAEKHGQAVLDHAIKLRDAVDPASGEPDYAAARTHVDAINSHAEKAGDPHLQRLGRGMDDHLKKIEQAETAPPTAGMLSTTAHSLSQQVRGHDPEGHETARRAHIAAADAHKARGDEEMALNHVMFADSHRERADQGQEIAKANPDPENVPYHVGDTTKTEVDAAELRAGDYMQHSGKNVRVADVQHHGDVAHVRFRDPELGTGNAYLKHGEKRRVTRVVRPDER